MGADSQFLRRVDTGAGTEDEVENILGVDSKARDLGGSEFERTGDVACF